MNEIQWQMKKCGWNNTEIWKAKGKAVDTNTGQDTRASPNSLETLHGIQSWCAFMRLNYIPQMLKHTEQQ